MPQIGELENWIDGQMLSTLFHIKEISSWQQNTDPEIPENAKSFEKWGYLGEFGVFGVQHDTPFRHWSDSTKRFRALDVEKQWLVVISFE